MSSMSYNSVYTPTAAIFRQSFTSPSLHGTTTSATSSNSYYHHQIDHQQQMVSHSLQQTPSQSTTVSTAQQWSPADKRNFYQSGSNNNSVNLPFNPGYQSTSAHVMDEKKTRHGFQGQHGIQSPTNSSVLPPPQGQAVQPLLTDNVLGRAPNRPLTNSKRAAQNRAAQRAFRQRKDRYIKDLEAKAKELDSTRKELETLRKEKEVMQQTIRRLEAENAKLKGEEVSDDDGRQGFGANNSNGAGSSNSNYSHYGNSTRDDDDSQVLGDEPWLRHKDSGRKGGFGANDDRPASFFPAGSSSSTSALNRPGPEYSQRVVLHPGPNTDSSVDPCFRPDYRNANSHSSPSPPSSSSSDRNNRAYQHNNSNNGRTGYPNNEEDSDRVYDDLCELMKTRSRPDLPHNINLWPSQHSPTQQNVVANGSSTVAG